MILRADRFRLDCERAFSFGICFGDLLALSFREWISIAGRRESAVFEEDCIFEFPNAL